MARLHIGSGRVALPGWVNVDIKALPEVDLVHDVTQGLPFSDVEFIFAEHFIEHLPFEAAFAFLCEARRALADTGVLRLSTPNLDWVLRSHYDPSRWASTTEPVRDCFWINKAFRGWGHCFLFNRETLNQALFEAGFAFVTTQQYGRSQYPVLVGLESHETYPDLPGEPHVLIVEASGRLGDASTGFAAARNDLLRAVEQS